MFSHPFWWMSPMVLTIADISCFSCQNSTYNVRTILNINSWRIWCSFAISHQNLYKKWGGKVFSLILFWHDLGLSPIYPAACCYPGVVISSRIMVRNHFWSFIQAPEHFPPWIFFNSKVIMKFKYFWSGSKNLKISPTWFWHYYLIDFKKNCGLLTISEL